jgi:hypothetical protein
MPKNAASVNNTMSVTIADTCNTSACLSLIGCLLLIRSHLPPVSVCPSVYNPAFGLILQTTPPLAVPKQNRSLLIDLDRDRHIA